MIPCVHPLVIWLVDGRIIMPCSFRGEICLVFFQPDFDSPQRASHQLVRRKPAAHATIAILCRTVIHGRGSGRSMTDNPEIKLDATRCPWPTHGYVPEFNGIVAVNKLLPGFFIDSAPNLPADFRQNIQFNIFIFKGDDGPLLINCFCRETIKTEIWINGFRRVGNWIGIRKWVSPHYLLRLRDSCFLSE